MPEDVKLAAAICPQCGATLKVDKARECAYCTYCGTEFVVDKAVNTYNVQHATIKHVDAVNIIKTNSVDSVLNFVKDQQKRIDDKKEKKAAEEEKRRQEEQQKLKQDLKYLLLIAPVLIVIIVLGCIFSPEPEDGISATKSASDFKGEIYTTVIEDLQNAGFTSIETEVLPDLISGWLTKDGEVEEISIDGDADFTASTKFTEDALVIITYHTFPDTTKDDSSEITSDTNASSADSNIALDDTSGSSDVSADESMPEILTVENCEDFAAILKVLNPGDSSVSAFAATYIGHTIEFDANFAYVAPMNDENTVYDILICCDDYSETTSCGPNFKLAEVSISDLNFIGDSIPANIEIGQNVRIRATIKNYNATSELLFLKAISTEMR